MVGAAAAAGVWLPLVLTATELLTSCQTSRDPKDQPHFRSTETGNDVTHSSKRFEVNCSQFVGDDKLPPVAMGTSHDSVSMETPDRPAKLCRYLETGSDTAPESITFDDDDNDDDDDDDEDEDDEYEDHYDEYDNNDDDWRVDRHLEFTPPNNSNNNELSLSSPSLSSSSSSSSSLSSSSLISPRNEFFNGDKFHSNYDDAYTEEEVDEEEEEDEDDDEEEEEEEMDREWIQRGINGTGIENGKHETKDDSSQDPIQPTFLSNIKQSRTVKEVSFLPKPNTNTTTDNRSGEVNASAATVVPDWSYRDTFFDYDYKEDDDDDDAEDDDDEVIKSNDYNQRTFLDSFLHNNDKWMANDSAGEGEVGGDGRRNMVEKHPGGYRSHVFHLGWMDDENFVTNFSIFVWLLAAIVFVAMAIAIARYKRFATTLLDKVRSAKRRREGAMNRAMGGAQEESNNLLTHAQV